MFFFVVAERVRLTGTDPYLAPEITATNDPHDSRADIWSIGVIIYELFSGGQIPYFSNERRDYRKKLEFPECIPKAGRQLISQILMKNPSDRISLSDMMNQIRTQLSDEFEKKKRHDAFGPPPTVYDLNNNADIIDEMEEEEDLQISYVKEVVCEEEADKREKQKEEKDMESSIMIKISSWNVNGLNSRLKTGKNKKSDLMMYLESSPPFPDVLCLQDNKVKKRTVENYKEDDLAYKYRYCTKDGEVMLLSKIEPKYTSFDQRWLTLEFQNTFVVGVYAPNPLGGEKNLQKRMEWNTKFKAYISSLQDKNVVIIGDLNACGDPLLDIHPELVLAEQQYIEEDVTGANTAGFRQILQDLDLKDSFRELYPKERRFSYWKYSKEQQHKHTRDRGKRLDYALVSSQMCPKNSSEKNLSLVVVDSLIRTEIGGSDHSPIELILRGEL